MAQGQVGLNHHGAVICILGIGLEALGLLHSQRSPIHAVGAVNFLGNQLNPLTQGHLQGIQELDFALLLAGLHDGLSQLDGAFAAQSPVVGQSAAHAMVSTQLPQQSDFGLGVGVELVDAHHGHDAGLLDGGNMVEQVLGALLQQLQVLLGVLHRQGTAGNHGGSAAVHLQSTDGGNQNGNVGGQAGQTALDVPELLEADVGSEAGLGHVVVKQLQSQTVADNGGLADSDVGKRTGVDQHGLMLHGVAHGGVDGVTHPGGHGAGHFQILGGDGLAAAAVSHNNLADAVTEILQVTGNSQNSHQLGANGDAELGLHQVAVLGAADADDDVPQALSAEVHDPAHFHTLGVNIQTLQAALGQLLVVVVTLVLHTGVQGYHSQVMCIDNIVDITGQAQRELGHGDEQSVAAAGSSALHVHGGAAGGLTQAAAYILAQLAQTFNQAQGNGGLAFAQGGGGNCRDFDELAVGLILQTVHDLDEVQLGGLAIGNDFVRQQAQLLTEVVYRGKGLFCFFSDLPVLVDGGVKGNLAVLIYVLAISELDCHS